MKVSIASKMRGGFSLAIFITMVMAETETVAGIDIHERKGVIVCVALALAGCIIWAANTFGKARRAGSGASAGKPGPEDPFASFRSGRYWGAMLICSAVVLAAASSYRFQRPKPKSVVSVPAPKSGLYDLAPGTSHYEFGSETSRRFSA